MITCIEKLQVDACQISNLSKLPHSTSLFCHFRHKERFMSKLHSHSVITQHGHSPQPQPPPSAPTAPEAQALVTFSPPLHREPPPDEVKDGEEDNEEEQCLNERTEPMHFNNTSYFFLQQRWWLQRKGDKAEHLTDLSCWTVAFHFQWSQPISFCFSNKLEANSGTACTDCLLFHLSNAVECLKYL